MPQPARNYCHLQKYKQHYPIKAADNTAQQMSGVSEENDKNQQQDSDTKTMETLYAGASIILFFL